MERLLSDKVMQCTPIEKRDAWEAASPLSHVSDEAPPMFVIQGTHDTLVWVEEARAFVSALQAVSRESVVYAELPGAQHAFEIFHSVRTEQTVNACGRFSGVVARALAESRIS